MKAALRSICVHDHNPFEKFGCDDDGDANCGPNIANMSSNHHPVRQPFAAEQQQDYEMVLSDTTTITTSSPTPSNPLFAATSTDNSCNPGKHFRNAQDIVSIQGPMNPGYASDDEASESDTDYKPGRTRSSTRRANQATSNDSGTRQEHRPNRDSGKAAKDGRGSKRKKAAQDGSGGDSDEGNERRRTRLDLVQSEKLEEPTCLCPKNVMRCIGILPSLSIISQFHDSDDSDSSFDDDLRHTVLPRVARSHIEHQG